MATPESFGQLEQQVAKLVTTNRWRSYLNAVLSLALIVMIIVMIPLAFTVSDLADNGARTNCRTPYTDAANAAQGQAFVDLLDANPGIREITGAAPPSPGEIIRHYQELIETTETIQPDFLLNKCGKAK